MKIIKFFWSILLITTIVFALEPAKANLKPLPKLRGDEILPSSGGVPYFGGRQSPGDQIGTTWYDYQAGGSFGQRIMVDDYNQAHIDWMKMDAGQTVRFCAWNARYTDGTYYGETQTCWSWSGYVQLDITREVNPDIQRSVICYHYNPGVGYYSWIDIDQGNLWGAWPNNPKTPGYDGYIWSYIAVTNNGNIVMATGDLNADILHLFLTTDEGTTWTLIADFDSCATLSQFVRSSPNSGSNKVVFVHTQFITDTVAGGQMDNDVYYVLSTDGGLTWGPHINVTNYQPYPTDSVRAYCNVNAIFDNNDNLHIAWGGRKVTDDYYDASKIFHWDEVSDTITIVSSPSIYYSEPGGWWITVTGAGVPGAWRMPADQPQLVIELDGDLVCFWHGNDDYNDYSAGGYFNGEIYGAGSTNGGLSWSDYVNLTCTRSPGAPAGACYDEDYMTATPFEVNDSIYPTYIEDKDAGCASANEGTWTENPVRCWMFYQWGPGVTEEQSQKPEYVTSMLEIYPNPFSKLTKISFGKGQSAKSIELKIYNATGRLVKDLSRTTPYAHILGWHRPS